MDNLPWFFIVIWINKLFLVIFNCDYNSPFQDVRDIWHIDGRPISCGILFIRLNCILFASSVCLNAQMKPFRGETILLFVVGLEIWTSACSFWNTSELCTSWKDCIVILYKFDNKLYKCPLTFWYQKFLVRVFLVCFAFCLMYSRLCFELVYLFYISYL